MASEKDARLHRGRTIETVKGGWISREPSSGRFIEVRGTSGVSKATPKTEAAVKDASSKRREALKRLADR